MQTLAKEGKLFLNEMSLKISKRIIFSELYRPHIWQCLLENMILHPSEVQAAAQKILLNQ